jgi:hypothetical protein
MRTAFIDKLIKRIDKLEPGELQHVMLDLLREKGFLEKVFQALQEGIILLDTEKTRQGSKISWTPMPNLKALLSEFQVQVGDNQLLNARLRPATTVFAKANETSRNKVAMAFNQSMIINFVMESARTVSPIPQQPGAPQQKGFQVEDVIRVPSGQLRVFTENDPSIDPNDLVRDLLGKVFEFPGIGGCPGEGGGVAMYQRPTL